MHRDYKRLFQTCTLPVTLALASIVALSGCVQTCESVAPGPGHPASADSDSPTFTPPDNIFAHTLEPREDPAAAHPTMESSMPDMSRNDSDGKSLIVYSCPMHASVRSDRPGTCPECGMQLVPSRTSEHQHNKGEIP